jgi:DnaJ domain
MATEPDPYRTLGLDPNASLDEVKRAYRRLAKANHPDAAGASALPRFLAIQAAYERLVGPAPGRARTPTGPAAPRKSWEADPDRGNATRRAYGGRTRRPAGERADPPRGRPRPGGPGPAPSAGTAGAAGSSGPSAGGTDSGRSGRGPKKATLGSTSYDGADREAFEPDWVGGSWYGTTSGTYWTINPKEYADPRKHGPEYQARARRTARGDESVTAEPSVNAEASKVEPPAPEVAGPPRHSTSSWWEATSGPATPEPPREPAPEPPRAAPRPRPGPTHAPEPGGLSELGRALVTDARPTLGWRIARAIVGWLPIGLAIGWASGELTGCARFSATCDAGAAPIVWVIQAILLAVLVALPTVAGWAVVGALACLVVAVPTTLFVTATAGAAASQLGSVFLGTVLAVAWFAGSFGAVVVGRARLPRPRGPVS